MLSPHPGAPIVLMIPGSGPVDRDGNSPQGLKAATLKLLAQELAAAGIATVRIDKRAARSANVATYADPDLPLAVGVVENIAGFLKNSRP